jgi:hypothetical protein
MDDFLHNLRSGKLKQQDRGRRDYTDYKGPQRRVSSDRRRTDYYAKVTSENFALVKDTIDGLARQQKRIADALTERTGTASRIADALESIASMMGRHLGIEGPSPTRKAARSEKSDADAAGDAHSTSEGVTSDDEGMSAGPLDDQSRPKILDLIAAMRASGNSWEKIARHMDQKSVPTVSGKGKWRGPAVKKFWDANA